MRDIVFIGPLNLGGYSKLFRNFIDNIDNTTYYLYPIETIGEGINNNYYKNNIEFSIDEICDDSKFIYFSWPYIHSSILEKFRSKSRVNCLYTMVESYSLNNSYFKNLQHEYSKFIVPNEFQYNMFSEIYGKDNVEVIYPSIDKSFYKNIPRRQKCNFIKINTNTFNIVKTDVIKEEFVFINSSTFYYRKGIDIAIKSFLKSFSNESVALGLFIKPFYGNRDTTLNTIINMICNCKCNINNNTPYIYLCEDLFSEEMSYIPYSWGNCLLHPCRGEGIGLTLLEASACGIPIVCSLSASLSNYFNSDNAFVVEVDKIRNIGYKKDNKFYIGKFPQWKNDLIMEYQYNCDFAIMDSPKIVDDFIDRIKVVYNNFDSNIVIDKINNMNFTLDVNFNPQKNINKFFNYIKNV